jgi:hypothetical protein
MADPELAGRITDLLRETGEAHHEAFADTDGADPDWAIWYAERMHQRLGALLGATITKSELVYLLMSAGKEQAIRAPGSDWRKYYAQFLVERYP